MAKPGGSARRSDARRNGLAAAGGAAAETALPTRKPCCTTTWLSRNPLFLTASRSAQAFPLLAAAPSCARAARTGSFRFHSSHTVTCVTLHRDLHHSSEKNHPPKRF